MDNQLLNLLQILSWGLTVKANCYGKADPWIPSWLPDRTDLLCDSYCDMYKNLQVTLFEYESWDNCCTCRSCTTWAGQETSLFVEYVTVTGRSIVIAQEDFNNNTWYKVEHRFSEMTEIPSNLCQWDTESDIASKYKDEMTKIEAFQERIAVLNFEFNKIRKVVDLNCLRHVDTINLRYNKVTYLSNTTIANLTYLRNLDMSYNEIKHLDPMIFFSPTISVYYADFSHNVLTEIDVGNAITQLPFCRIDYTANMIDNVINEMNIRLNHSMKYGPGIVDFGDNIFQKWPDFVELFGLNSLTELSALFAGGFDFRGIKIDCDCNLEPFVSLVGNITKAFWRDYHNVTCFTPPELEGRTIVNIPPELLVCPLTAESNCPRGCKCVDRTSLDILFVDCSNLDLTEMPLTLPESKLSTFISLNVSRNKIRKLSNRTYLPKLVNVDISNNEIENIDNTIAGLLENTSLDISNNRLLSELPNMFQLRNLCTTKLINLTVNCNCQSKWIEQWLKSKKCGQDPEFQCHVPETGLIPASEFEKSLLSCNEDLRILVTIAIVVAFITLVLLIVGVILIQFRNEVLVLWLRYRQYDVEIPIPGFQWDLCITFDETDDDLCGWVKKYLTDELDTKGYRVFIPYRDVPFGSDRDRYVNDVFSQIRSFLVVLSDNYFTDDSDADFDSTGRKWTENEWKYAWHQYKKDKMKNLVIINYDHSLTSTISQAQIRAVLRVGHTVQFGNHDNSVMEMIMKKLGPPGKDKTKMHNLDNLYIKDYRRNARQARSGIRYNQVLPDIGDSVDRLVFKPHDYCLQQKIQMCENKAHLFQTERVAVLYQGFDRFRKVKY